MRPSCERRTAKVGRERKNLVRRFGAEVIVDVLEAIGIDIATATW